MYPCVILHCAYRVPTGRDLASQCFSNLLGCQALNIPTTPTAVPVSMKKNARAVPSYACTYGSSRVTIQRMVQTCTFSNECCSLFTDTTCTLGHLLLLVRMDHDQAFTDTLAMHPL